MTAQKTLAFLSLAITAGLMSVQAARADGGPRYTYVEGGWQSVELSSTGIPGEQDPDGDGFSGGASYAVTDLFHVFAGYSSVTLDVLGGDVDLTELNVGAGINYAVTEAIDVVGRAAYVDAEADVDGGGTSSDSGYRLEAGLRGMATPSIEINGGLSYEDEGSDASDRLAVRVGAFYSVLDWLALGIGGSFSGDTKVYGATVRAYFGGR